MAEVWEGWFTVGIVFVAFGGGLTWGATTLRWGNRVEPVATSDAALPPTDKTGLQLLLERPGREDQ